MTNTYRIDWVITPDAPTAFLNGLDGIHPLVAQVLWARGLRDAERALAFMGADAGTCDPFAFADIGPAAERILRAAGAGEPIAIYGDYDCDGVTACALLQSTLTLLGANARVYIPDRFEEGYGLNSAALDKLKAEGIGLVVTVDCGARAMAEAQHAREIGLDLVVTDHHELDAGALPAALAVVNPKRADCAYPFKQLAGVGVAYRLAQCLLQSASRATGRAFDDTALLDLVAIGTVADVVPLIGENRQLVRDGLRRINAEPRAGVRYLAAAARARLGAITAQTIGFALAPRLNAAGRIDTALDAYHLMSTDDESVASQIALRLNERNEQRQRVTADVTHGAETLAAAGGDIAELPLLFAVSDSYNAGVIGLAAARLVERYYKPAVVVATHMGEARGSCRSVEGFHITAALDECKPLLSRHGGHAAAAGFSTPAVCLDELRQRLLDIARREQPEGGWTRALHLDAEVHLHKLSWESFDQLGRLEPHGMANPRPAFAARGAVVQSIRRVGKTPGPPDAPPAPGPHLQLRLKDSRGATWDAIGWRMGERAAGLSSGAKIDLAFQIDVNEWNGEKKLQLVLQDFRMTDDR
jgi:single-stranded-DNA-specific exonuclease